MQALKHLCIELNIPLAEDKQDGPTTVIVFLGIIIDTIKQELRLPEDKLKRLLELVQQWLGRKSCTRWDLESLIRVLQHACKVIPPGRAFLRQVVMLLSTAHRSYHHIRLNKEFRADLAWWKVFATHWNGASLIIHQKSPEQVLTSDASGAWGCGAWHEEMWFQLEWNATASLWAISTKELIPIIIAKVVWGSRWKGCRVLARCDNAAVVAVLNSCYAKDTMLSKMLRCLFFVESHFQFTLKAAHIPGVHNDLADDLSRNRLQSFLSKMPCANTSPSPISPSILQWLFHTQLDWLSPAWTELFSSSVHEA